MVCSECIQLVTEDAVNKKRCGHEERQQEWTDVKLQYLLQLRHSIVTCVCIHMMRDVRAVRVMIRYQPSSQKDAISSHSSALVYECY